MKKLKRFIFACVSLHALLSFHGRYWQGGNCKNLNGLTPGDASKSAFEFADELLK